MSIAISMLSVLIAGLIGNTTNILTPEIRQLLNLSSVDLPDVCCLHIQQPSFQGAVNLAENSDEEKTSETLPAGRTTFTTIEDIHYIDRSEEYVSLETAKEASVSTSNPNGWIRGSGVR